MSRKKNKKSKESAQKPDIQPMDFSKRLVRITEENPKSKKISLVIPMLIGLGLGGLAGLYFSGGYNYLLSSFASRVQTESIRQEDKRSLLEQKASQNSITLSSFSDIKKLGNVKEVIHDAEKPDIIYICNYHPRQLAIGDKLDIQFMEALEKTCLALYDNLNVKSIILEGLHKKHENWYREKKRLDLDYTKHYPGKTKATTELTICLQHLLNSREWNMHSGENEEICTYLDSEISKARQMMIRKIKALEPEADEITQKYTVKFGKVYTFDKRRDEELNSEMKKMLLRKREEFKKEIDESFSSEAIDRIYDYAVVQREKDYIDICRQMKEQGKGPTIVLLGTGHAPSFYTRAEGLSVMTLDLVSSREAEDCQTFDCPA